MNFKVSLLYKVILFFSVSFFFSCKKQFKPANEAFFITCKEVKINTEANQGYGSHKVTDLWLYTNGFFRGVFPVGSKMPIMIENGKSKIDIFPGIMNNGISTTRNTWIFYEPIKLDTTAKSGDNFVRNFSFKYKSSVVFHWIENFELPGFSLIKSSVSDTTFKVHTNDEHVFEGNKSIEFGLSGNGFRAQLESAATYSLPLNTGNVYLEVDYKCNTDFIIGIYSNGFTSEAVTVTKKENWNKIYVQLATAINMDKTTSMKKIIFRVDRNSSIPNQYVFLDNIKLVTL